MPRRTISATPAQWARLATYVRLRREAKYPSRDEAVAAAGGLLKHSAWGYAENGNPPTGKMAVNSIIGICRALGWTEGSVEDILAGREPEEIPERERRSATPLSAEEIELRFRRLEQGVSDLAARLDELFRQRETDQGDR